MALIAGTRLGPYEILSPLGAGGMGEVYQARDERLKRDVAIKVLPASYSADRDRLRRFEQEAQAAGGLNHPNIMAVHDLGSHDGAPYIVTELLEGETLRAILSGAKLPQRKAIDYALQIAHGLAAAHEKGIVHRDLKPENLFVLNDGRVKILDFGLAKLTQTEYMGSNATSLPTETPGTEPGVVLGTLGYMSPEQVRGKPAGSSSDIFSFGAVLYEMLSGVRAFHGASAADTMSAILNEDPPDLALANQNISPGLERIVHHCLEKNPEQRFHSAHDLAFDLSSLSTAKSGSGAMRTERRDPSWMRRLSLAAVSVAFLAFAFWAGGAMLSRGARENARFSRITFRRGNILGARFTPDGQTVAYGAALEGKPSELLSVRADSVESRPLGIEHADILSISSKGELAIKLRKGSFQSPEISGTLARVPLGGGAPRELEEDVFGAVWTPDANAMAIIRFTPEGKSRLEWPIGHILYESFFLGNHLAMSPAGDLVAFTETDNGGQGTIWTVDRQGKKQVLTRGWSDLNRIVWSRRTDEVLFTGSGRGGGAAVRAVSRSGRDRVLWETSPEFVLHDVADDGRLLIERGAARRSVIWRAPGATQDKELGWLDGSELAQLSPDGNEMLFTESGDGAGGRKGVYLRPMDGGPAIRLGDGTPVGFSPDGKWAVTISATLPPEVVLLPIGPGSPRKISTPGLTPVLAFMLADGKTLVVISSSPGQPFRAYVLKGAGPVEALAMEPFGLPTAVDLPGINWDAHGAFSRDGTLTAYSTTDRKILIQVTGGSTRQIPGALLGPGEYITVFSADNRFLQTQTSAETPARIYRTDVETGAKTLWKEIQPVDAAGVVGIGQVRFTRGDAGYAYTYGRIEASDLYVVDGLK